MTVSGPFPPGESVTPAAGISSRRRGWWSAFIQVVTLGTAFLVIAAIGAKQAARDERVLSFMEPLIAVIRTHGWATTVWLVAQRAAVGWAITAIATVLALVAIVVGRVRATPIVLLLAGASLATWGQVMLFSDRPQAGVVLYALGAVCFVVLGAWCPLQRLSGFPSLPLPRRRGQARDLTPPADAYLRWGWECLIVLLLSFAALLTRTYALSELPQGFDLETIDAIITSRTWYGLVLYIQYGLTANSAGIVHYLPKKLLFDLYGTSVYSLRLSAVVFGVAAVPLLYWLVRRMAGVGAAIAATVLLIVAPEQLYWSRIETAQFAPIAVLGLVTAHLGLWMVERLSVWAVLAAALWTPASRFAYAPAYILVAYPALVYGHAVVFVRGAWRKGWYVVPLLAAGVVLWILSVSIVYAGLNGWHWRFVNPAFIFGAPAWRMHGQPGFRDAALFELVRLQAVAMTAKCKEVIAGFWYHDPRMFSQWFQRGCALPNHLTVLNAGVAVMFPLGFGYLLGQFYDRRAFALLMWVALALLPAVMSDEPTTRRLSLMFPAIYAVGGVLLAAVVGVVRTRAGRGLAHVTAAALGVAVAGIAWTGLASHLRVGTGPVWTVPMARFAMPLLRDDDAILHNLDPGITKAILLSNLDAFVAAPPCFDYVRDADWLKTALQLPCDFEGYVYQLTMPPEKRAALRQAYNPRRIAFLLEETPYSQGYVQLLQRLYPAARVERTRFQQDQRSLVSLRVDIADVRALRSPALLTDPDAGDTQGLAAALLAGVTLRPGDALPADAPATAGIVVRGGLFLEHNGWYRFQVGAHCPDAQLTLDDRPLLPTDTRPLLAGVHPFEITLPSATACPLPLQVLMASHERPGLTPVPPEGFVSPAVAALPQAQAEPVVPYEGYGEVAVAAQWRGGGIDFGIDAQGHVWVLVLEEGKYRVQRFGRDGREESRWEPPIPPGVVARAMAVDGDGTIAIAADASVLLRDAAGQETRWRTSWDALPTDIAFAPSGQILLLVPSRNGIAVFNHNGTLQGELTRFQGGPGQFTQPQSVSVSADGNMLVIQDDGRVLLFKIGDDLLQPIFINELHAAFGHLPISARGAAFDGADRLLLPDASTNVPLVYDAHGQRLMATSPARDLSTKELGGVWRFYPTADRLYALESSRVWSLAR